MTHPGRDALAAIAAKEDLVQGIVTVLERSFTTDDQVTATRGLAEFFRALDEPTLRAIAYRHGVFEGAGEAEPEREDRDKA